MSDPANGALLNALDTLEDELPDCLKGEEGREAKAWDMARLERGPRDEETSVEAAAWDSDPGFRAHMTALGWVPYPEPPPSQHLRLRKLPAEWTADPQTGVKPADARLAELRQEQQQHEERWVRLLKAAAVVSPFAVRHRIDLTPVRLLELRERPERAAELTRDVEMLRQLVLALDLDGGPPDEPGNKGGRPKRGQPGINARLIDLWDKKPEAQTWGAAKLADALDCARSSVQDCPAFKEREEIRALARAEKQRDAARRRR
jgi:hypothetical protein